MIRNHITGLGVVVVREATQATAEASRCATSRQRPPTSSSHPAPSPRLAREAVVLRHSSTSAASPSPHQGPAGVSAAQMHTSFLRREEEP